ncbi:hypothetical protein [Pseudarthrobacter sp. PS3-L1]|uniref:hypothetical protein n=1 Tax=Pseudarthrobacter sp. PS3-L1 TaxID=3046207 RepID=UPI0024B8A39F|nr:hypothetical protein [Pseudarthrobacter sp. PS3-L1]MDJ0321683.1 hypothetical protein [Pseudarthrobacter sp. PS3-L1]
MSNEIVPMGTMSKVEYAKTLAVSNLLPKAYQNNPANLLFAIEFAEALGMKPIHAITSVHVINGKPSASADLIGTMVRRAGHRLRVVGDDTYAEATLVRQDDPDFEFKARWDISKAKQAGLNTPTWKNYPAAMLRSRAITEVCRAGAPDAMHGIQHSTEELESLGESPSQAPAQSVADRLRAEVPAPTDIPVDDDGVVDEPTDWIALADAANGNETELRRIHASAEMAGAHSADLEYIRGSVK